VDDDVGDATGADDEDVRHALLLCVNEGGGLYAFCLFPCGFFAIWRTGTRGESMGRSPARAACTSRQGCCNDLRDWDKLSALRAGAVEFGRKRDRKVVSVSPVSA